MQALKRHKGVCLLLRRSGVLAPTSLRSVLVCTPQGAGNVPTLIQYEDLKNIDSRDSNELYYHTSIDNEDADLIYYFNDDNKLYQVAFVFTDTHTNYNYYLSSYFKMLENLSKKYGDPSVTKKNEGFTYSAYNDDAKALEMGVLGYDTYWKLNNMNIALVLKSDNDEMHYILAYFSTKYHETIDQSAF